MDPRDRRRELAEEFQLALTGEPSDSPWGLVPDRVALLRPSRDDIELWLLAVHYPDVTRHMQLSQGRKGHFTRRLRKVWEACVASYTTLDREGRPGYYEAWTTGNAHFSDPTSLGVLWARSMRYAEQLGQLLFNHVAGPNNYAPTGRGRIRLRFLGGSIGEGESAARVRHHQSEELMALACEQARDASHNAEARAELLSARLAAIRAVDLTPGRSG